MFNNADPAPPVNNLLQPDIYNRLDAEVIERTRVINTQLDQRLLVQQRIISKYRLAAERFHRREKEKVKDELNRITTKLPSASRIRDFRSKFLYGARPQLNGNKHPNNQHHHNKGDSSVSQSVPELHVKKIRGVPEEKPDLPFCERFFIHHLPTKKKYYKARTPPPPPFTSRGVGVGEAGGEGGEGGGEGGTTVVNEDGSLAAKPVSGSEVAIKQPESVRETDRDPLRLDAQSRRLSPIQDSSSLPSKSPAEAPPDHSFLSARDLPFDDESRVRVDNRNRRHSVNGRQSPSKPSKREITRMSLPPLTKQNIRLAQSSPELYHGKT